MTDSRPGMLRLLVVTLACLLCGDSSHKYLRQLADLGPLPRRCRRCGGSVLATSVTVRWVHDPAVVLDFESDRPKIGRPRKHVAHG